MDKKQFFHSFIVDATDEAGHVLDGFRVINGFFQSIETFVTNPEMRAKVTPLFHEIALRAWMFDVAFNGGWKGVGSDASADHGSVPLWPLVAIYLYGEPFFVNKAYCEASGLSPAEIRSYVLSDHLYEELYPNDDAQRARAGVRRLRAGKGYRDLGLSMKHIHRTTFWNSYGGGSGEMEIRIGRDVPDSEDVHEDYYQGHLMNSVSILESLYSQLSGIVPIPSRFRSQLFWIAEYFSLFDFFWNHGGFVMENIFFSEADRGVAGAT